MNAPTKFREHRRACILVLLVAIAPPLVAQVAPTIAIVRGAAVTIVRNPSPDPLAVTVELRYRFVNADRTVTLGYAVRALVSPATFVLAPGERQTVRLRLHESVAPGTVLGFVVTFTPVDADRPAPGSDTAPVARLVVVNRIIGKATVAP